MFKFKLGQEVIYDGEIYKVISRSYKDSYCDNVIYYLIENDKGSRPFITESKLKEKPKYKITIQNGDKTEVIYAEDFIMNPKQINLSHGIYSSTGMNADGREIDELWGIKLVGGLYE